MNPNPSSSSIPPHLLSLPLELPFTKTAAFDLAKSALLEIQCRWGSCEVKSNCLSAAQEHYHRHSARAHEAEYKRGADAEYICRVKQCPNPMYSSMDELGQHINQAHIGTLQIPCPLKGCFYTFMAGNPTAFHQHLRSLHPSRLDQTISLLDSLKPLANPQPATLSANLPRLPSSTSATKAYPLPVIPAKRRAENLTRTLSAISAAGSSMQSISSSPRKRTRLSTRAFDPPPTPIAGPSSAPAAASSDEEGEDWDDTSMSKHPDDLAYSATAWNVPNLLAQRAKGPRWDKQRALGDNVVVRPTRAFPPKKKVQLSVPPTYKGRPKAAFKVRPDLMTTFTAMEERHKRLEEGGLFNVDVDTWVTRDGAEV